MYDQQGFLKFSRRELKKEDAKQRLRHYREFTSSFGRKHLSEQGSRCMDCGVPFCHKHCPLGNYIPDWNRLASSEDWEGALSLLHETNNFPEFTGRVCPAPCESACVLGINQEPVAIESIEMSLADMGFAKGWVKASPPSVESGRSVAIIGSGPTGLAAAQQLRRKGHQVVVYEREIRPGGLLMYGIPSFKLDKYRVQRRLMQLEKEGVVFICNTNIGEDISFDDLRARYDAVLLACGASQARDINVPGRDLSGIELASNFLSQTTKVNMADDSSNRISASGKRVVVIGGGDTGADCVGVSLRQGAASVRQFEIMDRPPDLGRYPKAYERQKGLWPDWPYMLRTSSSHKEGGERFWNLNTVSFEGVDGTVSGVRTVQVEKLENGYSKVSGTEMLWACDLVLIAIGFSGPEMQLLADNQISFPKDNDRDLSIKSYRTDKLGVFVAGDMRRGQSLVVWAIREGRDAALAIDQFLS